jgi:hypothetical protein
MLSDIYAECHYAKCHYAECRYAKCRYAKCLHTECRYAEWRGTNKTPHLSIKTLCRKNNNFPTV